MAGSDLTDNQVLLRLIIRGMDPAEVAALAQETYGQLKTEAAQHIDALTDYYKQSVAAQARIAKDSTDQQAQADKDAIDEKIAGETRALDAVTKLMRQQEIEANKARGAWHGIMEDLENITTVATGAFKIMSEGFERLKAGAEEIIKDTNIYNSLTGSIDEMRIATDGAVANIDLISAKNRGLEKDLKLTDSEFGVVAAAAAKYAHAIGIDAKDALDQMIDGMATGRTKMLQHAGIIIDVADANQKWADKMGTTVDSMTAQDKLVALQTEALEKMKSKMDEIGEEPDTLAQRFERGFVRIRNAITDTAATIGNLNVGAFLDPAGAYAQSRENLNKQAANTKKAAESQWDKEHADFEANNATGQPDYVPGIPNNDAMNDARGKMKIGSKRLDDAAAARAQAGQPYDNLISTLGGKAPSSTQGLDPDEDLQTKAASSQIDVGGLDEYVKASEAANAADEAHLVTMQKVKGLSVDTAVAYQKLAQQIGVETDALTHEEKMQAISNEAQVQFAALQKKLQKEADTRRAELKSTKDKAGFLSIFLWGTEGPSQTYKEMDEFAQHTVDTMGQMSALVGSAAQQLSGAIGKSLAATIEGAAGHKKSMQEMTHDALDAIATQALIKAVWEAAEGVASIAMYNFPGAALHFAAAAAYGAVGIAAGIGARAVGTPAAAAAPAASPSSSKPAGGLATSQSGNQGSGSSSGSGSSQQAAPVTINMTVMPGGEAESGRSIVRALTALQAQTGQSVQPLIASG